MSRSWEAASPSRSLKTPLTQPQIDKEQNFHRSLQNTWTAIAKSIKKKWNRWQCSKTSWTSQASVTTRTLRPHSRITRASKTEGSLQPKTTRPSLQYYWLQFKPKKPNLSKYKIFKMTPTVMGQGKRLRRIQTTRARKVAAKATSYLKARETVTISKKAKTTESKTIVLRWRRRTSRSRLIAIWARLYSSLRSIYITIKN